MQNIEIFKSARKSARKLSFLSEEIINLVLIEVAQKAIDSIPYLIAENNKDLARMEKTNPKYDRLLLNDKRIRAIAADIQKVAKLDYPCNKVMDSKILANGLKIRKISVPLGVVGIIYEARPNVTFDCFSLCIKSGNVVVLKGGSDAEFSNIAIVKIIHEILKKNNLDISIISLLPANREATDELLNAVGFVDVLIPRGSQSLIDYVRSHAKVPVIETGAGIVHVYFDEFGDIKKGKEIINNSKTRRVSVCNALDCLLISNARIEDLFVLVEPLVNNNVLLFADQPAYKALEGKYPAHLLQNATVFSFGTEFLDYKMAIKTIKTIDEAIDYITENGSKHSEAIVSENQAHIELFLKSIDASAVYANASTAFTDGAQFEMGAEIGISTQKLHARGPMALPELTSYKWLIEGNGQTRP